MSYMLNNAQKLNDIVFANRNKAYGAYVLRSEYGSTIAKSLAMVISGVASLGITAYLFSKGPDNSSSAAGQIILHDSVYVIPFDMKKETEKKATTPEENRPPLKQLDKKIDLVTTKLTVSDSVQPNRTAEIATVAVTSTSSVNTAETGSVSAGTGTTNTPSLAKDTRTAEIANAAYVDSEPEFEGGLKALYKFIKDNLRYPDQAYGAGVDGTVYVKFVVDETGKVNRLSLLNSKGYGLDEEALRVVGMIPKFKTPAKVQGQPVKVYYQLPIRFHITR